jgi:hypothetical protein
VLTIARIQSGTTANVIPETASLLGTLRTVSECTRRELHEGIRRVAAGVAAAHGVEPKVHIVPGYPVTVNDAGFVDFARATASELLGGERVIEMRAPIMGAEDFSYVLQRVPGALVFLGVRPDGGGPAAPIHSNRMLLNEDAFPGRRGAARRGGAALPRGRVAGHAVEGRRCRGARPALQVPQHRNVILEPEQPGGAVREAAPPELRERGRDRPALREAHEEPLVVERRRGVGREEGPGARGAHVHHGVGEDQRAAGANLVEQAMGGLPGLAGARELTDLHRQEEQRRCHHRRQRDGGDALRARATPSAESAAGPRRP